MQKISIRKVVTVIAIVVFLSQLHLFIRLGKATWLVFCQHLGPLNNSPARYPLALMGLTLFWVIVFRLLFRR